MKRWSPEDDEKLHQLFNEGKSDEEIAAELGRTKVAVIERRLPYHLKRGAAPKERAWTPEEIEVVKKGLEEGKSYVAIATLLPNRTGPQIWGFARSRLNHAGRKIRRWTPEEDDILTNEFLAYKPREEIATALQRNVGTLNQRVLHLGLKRDRRRAALSRRFMTIATDTRSIDVIQAEIVTKDLEEKVKRSAEEEAKVAEALRIMKYALDLGASRRPAFQAAMVAGATLQEVGDIEGITRERVRQIVHGVTPKATLVNLVRRIAALSDRDYEVVIKLSARSKT